MMILYHIIPDKKKCALIKLHTQGGGVFTAEGMIRLNPLSAIHSLVKVKL